MQTLEARIDEAFKRYRHTISLVDELIASRRNPQEIILLTCARLDSLANLAFTGKPQKDAFVSFLGQHAGATTTFEQISVADLYSFLAYQLWVLPGTIEKPGRLHMFDPLQDERYITFLWASDLPITVEALGALLRFILAALKRRYRVPSTQTLRRSSLDTHDRLSRYLESEATTHRKGLYCSAAAALLSRILVNSVEGYVIQLKKTQKLPWALFSDLCHFPSELNYLDERSIPEGRTVRIAVRSSGSTTA